MTWKWILLYVVKFSSILEFYYKYFINFEDKMHVFCI